MKKDFFLIVFFSILLCGCEDILGQIPVTVEATTSTEYVIAFQGDENKTSVEAMPGATIRFTAVAQESETKEIDEVWYRSVSIGDAPKVILTSSGGNAYEFIVPKYTIKLEASTKQKGS